MSQTLESSGFSPRQSNAVIESVALAMQTFAVTPEVLDQVLDQRIDKVMDALKDVRGDIKDLNTSMNRAFEKRDGDIKDLNKSIMHLERTMVENDRRTRRYWMGFSLALLGTVATIVAAG